MSTDPVDHGQPDGVEPPPLDFFVAERPVGLTEAEALFGETRGLIGQLNRIGDQIAASRRGRPPSAYTFLVSADWGTGKSTALRYIHEYVERVAKADGIADEIVFSWYEVPVHAPGRIGARASLLSTVLTALHAHAVRTGTIDRIDPVELLLLSVLGEQPPDVQHEDQQLVDLARRLRGGRTLAGALEDSITAGMVLESWLPTYFAAIGKPDLATVILIDDLDRCDDAGFVADLLVATHYWSKVTNTYVVLAADQGRLHKALATRLVGVDLAPDGGLAKYVHVTVHLPESIPGSEAAVALVRAHLERAERDPQRRAALLGHLVAVGERPPVLAPLLARCTPRELKKRVNGLLARLTGHSELSADVVRDEVLRVRWPQEYATYLVPAILNDSVQRAWCRHVVALGRMVNESSPPAEDEASRAARLADLAKRSGLDLQGVDPGIGLYLAQEPPTWLADRHSSGSTIDSSLAWDRLALSRDAGIITGSKSAPVRSGAPAEPGNLVGTAVAGPRGPELASLSYRVSELVTAAEVGSEHRMLQAYNAVMPELEASERIPADLAATLGNAALRFATLDLDEQALRLHICAVQADRSHVNVSQNLVDFILDHRVETLYPAAEQILAHIRTLGRSPTNLRPHRTSLLEIRLRQLRAEPVDRSELVDVVTSAVEPAASWSNGELFDLVSTLGQLGVFEHVPAVGAALLVVEQGDIVEQAKSLRGIADAMARASGAEEEFGVHLYLFLLRSGLIRHLRPGNQAETLANLAGVLDSRRVQPPAGFLLWHADQIAPEPQLKLRMARLYHALGDEETARRILDDPTFSPASPPAAPPFPQPIFPPSPAAEEFALRHLPPETHLEPMLPELFAEPQAPLEG